MVSQEHVILGSAVPHTYVSFCAVILLNGILLWFSLSADFCWSQQVKRHSPNKLMPFCRFFDIYLDINFVFSRTLN